MSLAVFTAMAFSAIVIFIGGILFSVNEKAVCMCCLLAGCLLMVLSITLVLPENQLSKYYLPCEIVATNETSTYFGTVDQDIQQIYAAETGDHVWPDDVPYLLHMDAKGTKTVADDEVLMVWRTD